MHGSSMMESTATCQCVQHPSFTGSHCETDINECMQGWIQDFLRGCLNVVVISEAGGLDATRCFINVTPKSCLMQDLEHI